MKVDVVRLLTFIKAQWSRLPGLFAVILLVILPLLGILAGTVGHVSGVEWLIVAVIIVLIVGFWCWCRRIPRARKGKVGIAVALSSETEEEGKRIKSDFTTSIRELLFEGGDRHHFEFVEFPAHHAEKVSKVSASRYLERSRCVFMVFGRTRSRLENGQPYCFLDLEGIVRHSSIPNAIRREFGRDFSDLFPRKLKISQENDVYSFEVAARWVELVARYIIGTAALHSWCLDYSETLFLDLKERLSHIQLDEPAVLKIRKRLPRRLRDVYLAQARLSHQRWTKDRERRYLSKLKFYTERLAEIAPNDYELCVLRAIWHFAAERDVGAARAQIDKCKRIKDPTWRYSDAFLDAYEGNLSRANKKYHSAFSRACPSVVLAQVEEFLDWVLAEEPDKSQLHFCLGLINLFAKKDKKLALQDLERFLEHCPENKYGEVRRLSERYIKGIREDLRRDGKDA